MKDEGFTKVETFARTCFLVSSMWLTSFLNINWEEIDKAESNTWNATKRRQKKKLRGDVVVVFDNLIRGSWGAIMISSLSWVTGLKEKFEAELEEV